MGFEGIKLDALYYDDPGSTPGKNPAEVLHAILRSWEGYNLSSIDTRNTTVHAWGPDMIDFLADCNTTEISVPPWREWAGQLDCMVPWERPNFRARSAFVKASGLGQVLSADYRAGQLTSTAVDALRESIEGAPNNLDTINLDLYGGKISDIPADATAFPHREGTLFHIQAYSSWSKAQGQEGSTISKEWLDNIATTIFPYTSGYAYRNYPSETQPSWPQAYFAGNVKRLIQQKSLYDPSGMFSSYTQSIPVVPKSCPGTGQDASWWIPVHVAVTSLAAVVVVCIAAIALVRLRRRCKESSRARQRPLEIRLIVDHYQEI